MADDLVFPPLWGDLTTLCAPIPPPPQPAGSGPVRESAHADAVFALRRLETAATMIRRHLETRPRDDFGLDMVAGIVADTMLAAEAHIGRFRRLREPVEVFDLAAARRDRDPSHLEDAGA